LDDDGPLRRRRRRIVNRRPWRGDDLDLSDDDDDDDDDDDPPEIPHDVPAPRYYNDDLGFDLDDGLPDVSVESDSDEDQPSEPDNNPVDVGPQHPPPIRPEPRPPIPSLRPEPRQFRTIVNLPRHDAARLLRQNDRGLPSMRQRIDDAIAQRLYRDDALRRAGFSPHAPYRPAMIEELKRREREQEREREAQFELEREMLRRQVRRRADEVLARRGIIGPPPPPPPPPRDDEERARLQDQLEEAERRDYVPRFHRPIDPNNDLGYGTMEGINGMEQFIQDQLPPPPPPPAPALLLPPPPPAPILTPAQQRRVANRLRRRQEEERRLQHARNVPTAPPQMFDNLGVGPLYWRPNCRPSLNLQTPVVGGFGTMCQTQAVNAVYENVLGLPPINYFSDLPNDVEGTPMYHSEGGQYGELQLLSFPRWFRHLDRTVYIPRGEPQSHIQSLSQAEFIEMSRTGIPPPNFRFAMGHLAHTDGIGHNVTIIERDGELILIDSEIHGPVRLRDEYRRKPLRWTYTNINNTGGGNSPAAPFNLVLSQAPINQVAPLANVHDEIL